METAKKPRFFITLRARLFIGFLTLSLPLVLLIVLLLPKINTLIQDTSKIIYMMDGYYSVDTGQREGKLYHDLRQHIAKNTEQISQTLITLKYFAYGLLVLAVMLTIMVPRFTFTKKITLVTDEIVAMVDKVINFANEQTESINSQALAINAISASLEEIDKNSKETMSKAQALRKIAKNTYEQGKLGIESVIQSINGIKASEDKMKLIAQTILDLSSHTQQIGEITQVVNALAQQSKMLALNASIEASKAGEAGRGFAAVATEVRNLAEQSEQSTVQVQKILEDIRRTTERAVMVTEEGSKTLASGTQLIEKAGGIIHILSKMTNDASVSSQLIEVAIGQEAVGIEQIVESMSKINETTSAFSAGIKEMTHFIHKLDDSAKHLRTDVTIYKI
jgi:methyl-accepting chemotaxis protein